MANGVRRVPPARQIDRFRMFQRGGSNRPQRRISGRVTSGSGGNIIITVKSSRGRSQPAPRSR